jgi:hypothetical protein
VSSQRIGGYQQTQDHHQASQSEPEHSQTAMHIHATCCDHRCLHDQQNNPASEHRAVNVKEPVGKWSSEDPGQLIGVREADKDRRKNHNSHAGKKNRRIGDWPAGLFQWP